MVFFLCVVHKLQFLKVQIFRPGAQGTIFPEGTFFLKTASQFFESISVLFVSDCWAHSILGHTQKRDIMLIWRRR